jgi:hypothetical protein
MEQTQDRISKQFEIAKKLYAAHRLMINAPLLDRQKIMTFLEQTKFDFETAGGIAATGTDVFGGSGPILSCENGDEVPYEAGTLLAENYMSSGMFSR